MVPYSDAPPCEEVVDEQLLRIAMRRHVRSWPNSDAPPRSKVGLRTEIE